jgi:peptidyl-prolyl cis-trans isomerase SurA
VQENAASEDTLIAYNKLVDARKEIMAGKDFKSVAKQYSEDPTVADNGGDLGYFGGFRMVYDFEDAAFNTLVGEVSQPFRTKFGFHIVKVMDKRKSEGELTVAHIMVANNKSEDSLQEQPVDRINDIYKKLQQGEDFATLAKQFSDDKASAKKGGVVNRFGKGQLSSDAFETAAFGLKEKGDFSAPVRSDFGWHIIKLIEKHPVLSFNEMKKELESKIKRGSRSKLITTAFKDKLKKQYNLPINEEAINYFSSLLNEDFYKRSWAIPESLTKDRSMVTIGEMDITYGDFAKYLAMAQRKMNSRKPFNIIVKESYDEFLGNQVLSYHEENLEDVNEDFRIIVEEYRDGLLLFDLMESEVWNAAKKDSIGLQDYFTKNAANYTWKVRAVAAVASSADKEVINKVKKYLVKDWNPEKIKEAINKKGKLNVIFTKDTMDIDHQALPEDFKFKEGVSDIYLYNQAYVVAKVDEVIQGTPKTFEEAKGMVISDFQQYFEDNWINSLKEKYKISINSKVMDKVRKEIHK